MNSYFFNDVKLCLNVLCFHQTYWTIVCLITLHIQFTVTCVTGNLLLSAFHGDDSIVLASRPNVTGKAEEQREIALPPLSAIIAPYDI